MRRSFAIVVTVLGLAMPATAQDRMPPIPAERLTDAQKKAMARRMNPIAVCAAIPVVATLSGNPKKIPAPKT